MKWRLELINKLAWYIVCGKKCAKLAANARPKLGISVFTVYVINSRFVENPEAPWTERAYTDCTP